MMKSIDLSVARRVVPEILEILKSRARILQRIHLLQPIGRRALAIELLSTERILRGEVDFLKQQGLIHVAAAGMSLSGDGEKLLDEMNHILAAVDGREEMQTELSRVLGIQHVYVVAGNCDDASWVKDALGYQAAQELKRRLESGDVLAVTGGSTMAAVARMMPAKGEAIRVQVVPARGGLGETVSVQANTIAGELAAHLGGSSIMLHVPDRLSEETMDRLLSEPLVMERLQVIRQARIVVHGIGGAMAMATRRQLTADEVVMLQQNGAIAEAFGYYFNAAGEIVYSMTTVGLRLNDLEQMRVVMGVAGGASKANAIAAVAKAYLIDVLVTDEGAAQQILRGHV